MKVWIVHVQVPYYTGYVDSVWSSEEQAKTRLEAMMLQGSEQPDVEEFEVDNPTP